MSKWNVFFNVRMSNLWECNQILFLPNWIIPNQFFKWLNVSCCHQPNGCVEPRSVFAFPWIIFITINHAVHPFAVSTGVCQGHQFTWHLVDVSHCWPCPTSKQSFHVSINNTSSVPDCCTVCCSRTCICLCRFWWDNVALIKKDSGISWDLCDCFHAQTNSPVETNPDLHVEN